MSVIRQKGESQNGGNKKAKHAKVSKKRTFLTPWYAHLRITDEFTSGTSKSLIAIFMILKLVFSQLFGTRQGIPFLSDAWILVGFYAVPMFH